VKVPGKDKAQRNEESVDVKPGWRIVWSNVVIGAGLFSRDNLGGGGGFWGARSNVEVKETPREKGETSRGEKRGLQQSRRPAQREKHTLIILRGGASFKEIFWKLKSMLVMVERRVSPY